MRGLLACLIVWAVFGNSFGASAGEPLHYGPAVVRLSGIIVIEAFFGRPNYGDDPENDEIERSPILVLDEPVVVEGDPDGDFDSESEDDVRRVHLVIIDDALWAKKWRHVVLEGTLFHSHTGHHHTRVLMRVNRLISSP